MLQGFAHTNGSGIRGGIKIGSGAGWGPGGLEQPGRGVDVASDYEPINDSPLPRGLGVVLG
jgi:hypothetical protein